MPQVSEFGQKWNVKVPRAAISWFVNRLHVSVSDDELASDIRGRCTAPGYTKSIVDQAIRYALICHHKNQELFSRVARGI